jgi:lipopolysaccharide export system protein LptA
MRRSEAARYARWSAGLALLLAIGTAGAYLNRQWSQHQDRKKAPPAPPQNVERQSNGLTFSKVEGDRKIFTVTASKSTDFKDKDATLLESVRITIFGKNNDRNDVINTQSCQYSKTNGAIECSGDVRMDLQSAADQARVAYDHSRMAQTVHVETSQVTFDRGTGIARTSRPVKLAFPSGTGQAVGVEYESEQGLVHLLSDVQFVLKPLEPPSSRKSVAPSLNREVHIRGTSLDLDRNSRKMILHGPAEAQTNNALLTSGEVLVELDPNFRAQGLRAGPGNGGKRPELTLQARDGTSNLSADSLSAFLTPGGSISRAEAAGNVVSSRQTLAERQDLSASNASLVLWPKVSQPRQLDLKGSVVLNTRAAKSAESRSLRTDALQIHFSTPDRGRASRIELARTLARGALEWTDAGAAAQQTKLKADSLEMHFDGAGKPAQLLASGNLSTERALPGRSVQTATARTGKAQLRPGGGWSQIDLQNEVTLREGERSARAERAVFLRDEQTATLTGKAMVRDATAETAAPRIVFHESSGDIVAEGGVRSTDLPSHAGSLSLAPAPANITADLMQANSKTGRALYSGHARYWQGESVLEAETIELLRPSRTLIATDHVRAVFPQAGTSLPGQSAGDTSKKGNLWHIAAALLTYYDSEGRARAERDVLAQSATQKTRAAAMDLYFTRSNMASSGVGARQISRGVATGGVTVEEGARKAVAERGEYTAAEGKFVMSGGTPTIFDGTAGATTGRQLTFFLASDTIIVDSENGSRILTKHRVER